MAKPETSSVSLASPELNETSPPSQKVTPKNSSKKTKKHKKKKRQSSYASSMCLTGVCFIIVSLFVAGFSFYLTYNEIDYESELEVRQIRNDNVILANRVDWQNVGPVKFLTNSNAREQHILYEILDSGIHDVNNFLFKNTVIGRFTKKESRDLFIDVEHGGVVGFRFRGGEQIFGSKKVNDGEEHTVSITFNEESLSFTLIIDDEIDVVGQFKSEVSSIPNDNPVATGIGFPNGGFVVYEDIN